MQDDLRRLPRVSVCCRAVVHDRYGVWTAVTQDVCARGCRILTARLLRPGAPLLLTLSSDLFPEELECAARVAWATLDTLGVAFAAARGRARGPSPEAWIEKVIAHGAIPGPRSRVVPVLVRPRGRSAPVVRMNDAVVRLPIRPPG